MKTTEAEAVHVIAMRTVTLRKSLLTLSEPVTQKVIGTEFTTAHVVVSHGRCGDTQIFPADERGQIVDLLSFWGRDGEHVSPTEAVREWLAGRS